MAFTKLVAGIGALFVPIFFWAQANNAVSFTQGQREIVGLFDSVSLQNGGWVTITRGESHSFTVVSGGRNVQVAKNGTTLEISCKKPCRDRAARAITLTMPNISKVSVNGGGDVRFNDGFPERARLTLSVRRGGQINARNVPAERVNATVTGGGRIITTATVNLDAEVVSGGSIMYAGTPNVDSNIVGGGDITPQ